MMGQRQVDQAALFYEFSLERTVPTSRLGNFTYATFVPTRPTKLGPASQEPISRPRLSSGCGSSARSSSRVVGWPQASPLALGVLPFKWKRPPNRGGLQITQYGALLVAVLEYPVDNDPNATH